MEPNSDEGRGKRRRRLGTLCRLIGYPRQAYYQQKVRMEGEVLQSELLLGEVAKLEATASLRSEKTVFADNPVQERARDHAGRDAFFRLMRDEGLLVRKRKLRKPRTTFSCPWMKKYPNLAKDFVPMAPNRLWVSDITYIRLKTGFVYLSLITDAYSRKIVWGITYAGTCRQSGAWRLAGWQLKTTRRGPT